MLKNTVRIFCSVSGLVAGGLMSHAVSAAQVNVTWESPEEYRDVKPTNQSRSKFREFTFKRLEEHLVSLAQSLPESQTLNITVTNLDLAGEVWPAQFVGFGSAGNDVRLIKDIDIPRMDFSYTLFDDAGQPIASEDVKLKDMGFLTHTQVRRRSDALAYEKQMIEDWFEDTF